MRAIRRKTPSKRAARGVSKTMTQQVLIVLHQEQSSPGRIGLMLRRRGFHLDIRRPALGDPLPKTLRHHAGAVIFGGPMSANDLHEYIKAEIDWIGVPLSEGKPFLGICLGAQMLARHLGARVSRHAEGRVEIGYYPLHATEASRDLFDWPGHVYQWHNEGFDIPRGGTLLATGGDFPNQAFAYGDTAYGLQFHPEVTLAMMHRWTVKGAPRCELPGAQPPHAHIEGRTMHDGAVSRWLDQFIDHWLEPKAAPALLAAE